MSKINFSGIVRNAPDNIIPDGSCNEMINVRYRDNAWRPVGNKTVKFGGVTSFDEYHIHTVDEDKIYIGYDRASGYIRYAINSFPSLASAGLNIGIFNNVELFSIGNTLIIDIWNEDYVNINTFYAVFKRNTGLYSNLIDFNIEPIIFNFYPSTFGDIPIPSTVSPSLIELHSFNNLNVYLGYDSSDLDNQHTVYWQYKIINGVITIVNLQSFGAWATQIRISSTEGDEAKLGVNILETIYYFVWDIVTNKYIPQSGQTWFYSSSGVVLPFISVEKKITFSSSGTKEEKQLAFEAAVVKKSAEAKLLGDYEGFIMVCYALKMFDGSYIKHSAPKLLYVGDKNAHLVDLGGGNYKITQIEFGSVLYDIPVSEQFIIDKLKTLSDVVKSIDIFITNPMSIFDYPNSFTDTGLIKLHPFEKYNYKTIVDQGGFYRIHSIEIDDKLKPVTGITTKINKQIEVSYLNNTLDFNTYLKQYYKENINDISTLTANVNLTLDNFSHHIKVGRVNQGYNKRVLKENTIVKLFSGFSPQYYLMNRITNGLYKIVLEVELNTEYGINIVRSNPYYTDVDNLTLPEILSYPDSRAKVLRVLIEDLPGYRVFKTLPLTSHPYLNISYFINPGKNKDVLLNDLGYDSVYESSFILPFFDDFIVMPFSDKVVSNIIFNSNEVQASEVNNPFLYPAKNSYQVGDGEIIGSASNSLPISQGQYGQHPIFVATTKGWWALNIQGGEIFIGSITPLNGSICNNPKSITYIDETILFSSDEGLCILQGTQTSNISTQLCIQPYSHLSDNDNYQLFLNNPALVELNNDSTVDFRQYLTNANICFDNHFREVIVSNTNYEYSYIFSLDAKNWTKRNEVFSHLIFDYPHVYSVDTLKSTVLQLNREEETETQQIVICTQPVKLGIEGFKKFERIMLRCNINQVVGKMFGFYLFASQDGREWQLIDGKQPSGEFNDVILSRSITFKEAIILIAGEVDKDSYITGMEYTAVEKLANKIR